VLSHSIELFSDIVHRLLVVKLKLCL
jgi:hypothetical protein